jgi:hypothetical protein
MQFTFIFNMNNQTSEWKQFKEARQVQAAGGPATIKVQGLKRKDGFKITHELWESLGHGMPDIFLCKGSFGEFRFAASRKKPGRIVSETYRVLLGVEFTDKELTIAHAQDIESALLNFPPVREEYKQVALEGVLFIDKGVLILREDLHQD